MIVCLSVCLSVVQPHCDTVSMVWRRRRRRRREIN